MMQHRNRSTVSHLKGQTRIYKGLERPRPIPQINPLKSPDSYLFMFASLNIIMRLLSLVGLTLLLHSHLAYAEKVPVKDIGDNFEIHGDSVTWQDGRFKGSLTCEGPDSVLSLSADKKHGTCCPPGQGLKGSVDTEWHCCGKGHDVTGNMDVGFECCLEGSIFDGKTCKRSDKCPNGKEMVNGKCQCPDGQEEDEDGTCKPAKCDSGIKTGMREFSTLFLLL